MPRCGWARRSGTSRRARSSSWSTPTRGSFFFLEVNTRLQVEHPVTELTTGVDLVREQFRLAAGEPLGYGQEDVEHHGHAIEARLYAEDPSAGFLPASGTLAAFAPAAEPAVRWDSGVESGSVVGTRFDPMLAKVIAHAPTRAEAAVPPGPRLERLHLGGVTTNRDFLAATLREPAFLAGDTTTDFIDRVRPPTTLELAEADLDRALVAAALWMQGRDRAGTDVLAGMPSGWRNTRMPPQSIAVEQGGTRHVVEYASPGRDGFVRDLDRRSRDRRAHAGPRLGARRHRAASRGAPGPASGDRGRRPAVRPGDRRALSSSACCRAFPALFPRPRRARSPRRCPGWSSTCAPRPAGR